MSAATSHPDYQSLFESGPALYLVLDPDLRIVAVSDAYGTATMTRREDILGRGIFDVFPDNPEDPQADGVRNLTASLQRVLQPRAGDAMRVQKYDIRKPEADGGGFEQRYWKPFNSPVLDDQGRIAWIIHQVEDVTSLVLAQKHGVEQGQLVDRLREQTSLLEAEIRARREAEKRLECERTLLRTFIDTLPDIAFTKDTDGRFVVSNRAHQQAEGKATESEISGKTTFDLHPPHLAKMYHADDLRVLRDGETVHNREEPFVGADGQEQWNLTTKAPLRDPAGQIIGLVGISRNIQDRKRADEEIRRLNASLELRIAERTAELEAANRELEAFSYSVSHDLRSPLRTVDGYSQALLEDFGPQLPEEGRRLLGIIRSGAQEMGNLIDDLLTFSRLSRQPLQRQPIATSQMVCQVIEDLKTHRREPEVRVCIGDLPGCEGDPALLKQVWLNLLSNAFKYTSKRPQPVVEIGCQQGAYFVRDNGTGFDMRYAHKLFGVFQRLHRAEDYEGTGVGLAIVQRVIHRHGGRVWAEAAVNRGATFYFNLSGRDRTESESEIYEPNQHD